MSISAAGLSLIKEFEGCKLTAYKDVKGVLTIGWGHTTSAGPPTVRTGMKISQADADRIFATDLIKYENAVSAAIDVPLNPNQYAACVSLCYNIGPGAFAKSSVAKFINKGKEAEAANALRMWNKAGGKVVAGLVRRREAERRLFLTPVVSVLNPPVVPETLDSIAAKGGRIATGTKKNKTAGKVAVGTGVVTTVTTVIDAAGGLTNVTASLHPFKDLFDAYGPWIAITAGIVLVGFGAFIWYQSHKIGKARVEDQNSGKTTSIGPVPSPAERQVR